MRLGTLLCCYAFTVQGGVARRGLAHLALQLTVLVLHALGHCCDARCQLRLDVGRLLVCRLCLALQLQARLVEIPQAALHVRGLILQTGRHSAQANDAQTGALA